MGNNSHLIIGREVVLGLKRGVDAVANIVKCTLGPKGKNVVIIVDDIPQIINDGVSIARKIRLFDPLENAGATMIKNVSKDTDRKYGDGTTTATILAQAILASGVEEDNINFFKLQLAFEFFVLEVEKYLTDNVRLIESDSDLLHVAMVSTNGDLELSELLLNAYTALGKECFITVKESPEGNTYLKTVKGLKYDSGWVSPFLTNDRIDKTAKYSHSEGCYVCYVGSELVNEIDIIPILELAAVERLPLLIIAERIYGEALAILIKNKLQTNYPVSAVVVPGLKHEHADIFADMICVTGGEVLNTEEGVQVHGAEISCFGRVDGFEVGSDYFILKNDKRDSEKVEDRVEHIKNEMKKYTHNLFEVSAKARIAKLNSGIGIIYIGGNSVIEITEKKLRCEDAVNALTCAVDKGYVPGGGIALFRASKHLEKKYADTVFSDEEVIALNILKSAMVKPFEQILINCNVQLDDDYLVEDKDFSFGYNGNTNLFEDMYEAGIVDPLSVTVGALRSAVSVSGIILSSGAAVFDSDQDINKKIIAGGY